MDSVEQEEVVKLIFGEEAPEGWRDNKEFILYLTELGTLGNTWSFYWIIKFFYFLLDHSLFYTEFNFFNLLYCIFTPTDKLVSGTKVGDDK